MIEAITKHTLLGCIYIISILFIPIISILFAEKHVYKEHLKEYNNQQ